MLKIELLKKPMKKRKKRMRLKIKVKDKNQSNSWIKIIHYNLIKKT